MAPTLRQAYLDRLRKWPAAVRPYLYTLPNNPDAACFGPGDHGHWSMQANNTAAAAFAILAVDAQTDWSDASMSRDETLDWALKMIRFNLRSHHAGGGAAADLQTWGHSWISALCLERLAHATDALGDRLPDEDRDLLHRVHLSESDWLLDHYEIVAGLVDDNKPESNIWNGCILHRTARELPDAPRHEEYVEKGTAFLLNGISTPSDATSDAIFAGRPLSEWHVGANMYDNMACNHHRYLNVGYMVICLSNIAMMHFSCRAHGWSIPDGLYHHARELWQVVKACTFEDGRLWRIGGDTRVRYCYCQDYAIPTWLLARDLWADDDVDAFERGWLGILEREAAANPDDRFLSARLAQLEEVSPLYYVRLEGDRAVTLSMGARYHAQLEASGRGETEPGDTTPPTEWRDDYHGSALVRGPKRAASVTWVAARPPQVTCMPPDASDACEWQGNLSPRIAGLGAFNDPKCEPTQNESFPGGWVTTGRIVVHSHQHISEGETEQDVATIDLACAALPDDRTVVVIQRAFTLGRAVLREVKGLYHQVPNDIFNGSVRRYATEAGSFESRGCPGTPATVDVEGDWLNVDDTLAVVRAYGPGLSIHRPADRQIYIKPYLARQHTEKAGGNLYVDEICMGVSTERALYDAGAPLVDVGALVLSGVSAEETEAIVRDARPKPVDAGGSELRGITCRGGDGAAYTVVANFGTGTARIAIDGSVLTASVSTDGESVSLPPGGTAVVRAG